jgi:hypothetical protein
MLSNSDVLTQVKDTFFSTANGDNFKERLRDFVDQFGLNVQEVKDLSVSALLLKLTGKASSDGEKNMISQLGKVSEALGISDQKIADLGL